MNPVFLTVAIAALALLGQGVNLYLFLRIRVSQLESEKSVLAEVESKYVPRRECALMCGTPEPRHAAD